MKAVKIQQIGIRLLAPVLFRHPTPRPTVKRRLVLALVTSPTVVWLALPAIGADRHWVGGTNRYLSEPSNWSPAGSLQNGDALIFDHNSNANLYNDVSNLVVDHLAFRNFDFTLDGNALTITPGISANWAIDNTTGTDHRTVIINCALTLGNDVKFATGAHEYCACASADTGPIYLHFNGPIDLNGHNLELDAIDNNSPGLPGPGNLFMSGNISGTGHITLKVQSNGYVEFSGPGNNSFSGPLTVSADPTATVALKQLGTAVNDWLAITLGTVRLDKPEQIGASATVAINGGGHLLLNGNTQTIGALSMADVSSDADSALIDTGGGLLILNGGISSSANNDHVHPIIKGRINLNGYLPLNISGGPEPGLEIAADIGGNGFYKSGSGTLRLGGNNSYWGDTEVTAGVIEARSSTAFGQSGQPSYGVHLEGGNITLQAVAIGAQPLFVSTLSQGNSFVTSYGQCSWAGPVNLDTNLNVLAVDPSSSGQALSLSGSITGPGGLDLFPAFLASGTVILTGSSNNTFTGPTTVNCQLLELAKPTGIRALNGPLNVGAAAGTGQNEVRWLNGYQGVGTALTLYSNAVVNLNNFNEDFGFVTFNGGEVDTGTGQFAIYQALTVNPAGSSAVINGYLGLPAGDARVFIVADGPADCDLIVNAQVFGDASYLVKQGPGKMCLTAANTYTGPTLLEEGTLNVNNGSSLSSVAAVIFNGATLQVDGSFFPTLANNFEIVGAGAGGTHGAIESINSGSVALTGSILLDASTTVNVAAASGLELNGVIGGTGSLNKIGEGVLSFGGGTANGFAGDTIVLAGEVDLAKPQFVAAVPGNLVLSPASTAAPVLVQFKASGQMAGTVITVNGNSVLDLYNNSQTVARLNLNDGGTVRTGAGALNFSSGGVVNVGSLGPSGSRFGSAIQGNIGIAANDSLTFNVGAYSSVPPSPAGPELDVPALISVNGLERPHVVPALLAKGGSGRMRLGVNNIYKGGTYVNSGTLQIDGAQPQSLVVVNSGATLSGSGSVGDISLADSTATVAPGDKPGILTCHNLNPTGPGSGSMAVNLNGTTPGTGYDQLDVKGTVSLSGISLRPVLNFASSVTDKFVIIHNEGGAPVVGTFNALAQNTTFYIGREQFQIDYAGGAGSDVVLTHLAGTAQAPPTLTIQNVPPASVALLWPTNVAGFLLQFTTDLATTNWIAVSPLPVVVGTNNVVSNSASALPHYYRLLGP